MKVYSVTYQSVLDGCDSNISTEVFGSRAKAEMLFGRLREEMREKSVKDDWEIEADDDEMFESYSEEWAMNHYCAYFKIFDI